MDAALFYAAPPWSECFGWTYVQRALWTVSLVSGGGLIYFLVLWLAGVRMAHFRGHH
jgi:hypothetical protein